ncbi:MAG: pyruvate kinase [Acidimicrobiia bacterium]|nr:pyruvate kinase [Acidimicrobiia bacterium]
MRRVKIVCTIGPATCHEAGIQGLLQAGMDMARLNGSHADLAWHAAAITLIRTCAPGIPILLDIPGRKIRTGTLTVEPVFEVGSTIILTTNPGDDGTRAVPVNRPDLHDHIKVGDAILADDGTLRFTVTAVRGRDLVCRAETSGTLRSAKGINVPGVAMGPQDLTPRDHAMIAFAVEHGVDFVGISFVESAAHVEAVRRLTGPSGPRILSKVENLGAMSNLSEVVRTSDAIMIDRGDLSVETNLEEVALMQKKILLAGLEHAVPVIVATEMLHSMIDNAVPTKAEVSDITNAVIDGATALMLSGETAVGRHPLAAVALMRRVADTVAESVQAGMDAAEGSTIPEAVGEAVALLCRRLPITRIVAITISGYAARMVAACRPRQGIIAVTNDPTRVRSLGLLHGTEAVLLPIVFSRTSTDHIVECLRLLWCEGRLGDDDLVLVTSVGYPRSGTRMNLIQTHAIRDLSVGLGWQR